MTVILFFKILERPFHLLEIPITHEHACRHQAPLGQLDDLFDDEVDFKTLELCHDH